MEYKLMCTECLFFLWLFCENNYMLTLRDNKSVSNSGAEIHD